MEIGSDNERESGLKIEHINPKFNFEVLKSLPQMPEMTIVITHKDTSENMPAKDKHYSPTTKEVEVPTDVVIENFSIQNISSRSLSKPEMVQLSKIQSLKMDLEEASFVNRFSRTSRQPETAFASASITYQNPQKPRHLSHLNRPQEPVYLSSVRVRSLSPNAGNFLSSLSLQNQSRPLDRSQHKDFFENQFVVSNAEIFPRFVNDKYLRRSRDNSSTNHTVSREKTGSRNTSISDQRISSSKPTIGREEVNL